MKRYIALLRGINIGGKNKISMAALKTGFAELGFVEVTTYLNSGNVVFSSTVDDINTLSNKIQLLIKESFDLHIPVFIISQESLEDILNHAPDWWGSNNKEIYDNLIFIFPSVSYNELYDALGNPGEAYEKVYHYENAVFWSFIRKDYQKTNWWSKTAHSSVSNEITIRKANTVKKIVSM